MTRKEAINRIANELDIPGTDAADLIDEYAINSGEVQSVDEIADVTENRIQEIIDDRRVFEANRDTK
jgi:hypothetical protein